jgi:membrane protein
LSRTRALAAALWAATLNFYRDNCLDLAATVAYYTLLSLGPLLYLVGSSLQLLFDAERSLETALGQIGTFLPAEAVTLLQAVVESLRRDEPLLLLAVPGLVWVAMSACASLEYAINVASGTASRRTFFHSHAKALLVLASGWAVLSLALFAGTVLPKVEEWRARLNLPWKPLQLSALGNWPLQLAATFVAFLAFFKFLPRGEVHWRFAAAGGVAALVLWECARWLFTAMLLRSPAFGLVTGTVAGVVAFLLWIYTAVSVVLFGAEVSAALGGRTARRPPDVR